MCKVEMINQASNLNLEPQTLKLELQLVYALPRLSKVMDKPGF
jgi:hypothetical protein